MDVKVKSSYNFLTKASCQIFSLFIVKFKKLEFSAPLTDQLAIRVA